MKNRILNIVLLAFIVAVLLPVHALAANTNDEVQISEEGDISIQSEHAAQEGISSLQFGLLVQATEPDAQVSFAFSESTAKIAEYRYHEDSGLLNIYLAGTTPLFTDSAVLPVGTVVVQDQDGKDVEAEVSVAEDSLQYVYGTELRMAEANLPEGPVTIHAEQLVKPDDGGEEIPKSEAFQDLQETLKNAESYAADSYTTESYQAMKKAMEEAKAVLNSPAPTEEEIENALQNLQNAMGALVLSSNDAKTDGDIGESGNAGTENKPETQESSGQSGEKVMPALTGDSTTLLPYAGLLLISAMGLGYICLSLRKKES